MKSLESDLLKDHECARCANFQGHGGTCDKCGSNDLILDDRVPCTCRNEQQTMNCCKKCPVNYPELIKGH